MSDENVSVDDMDWLVVQRSKNQATTMAIYQLYATYSGAIMIDQHFRITAQRLTSTAFSLWRAVFLSDIDNRKDLMVEDAMSFLKNLILHNSVTYGSDRKSHNYTFRYYIQGARDRLVELSEDQKLQLLPAKLRKSNGLTAHEWWEVNQGYLDKAVKKFEVTLRKAFPDQA